MSANTPFVLTPKLEEKMKTTTITVTLVLVALMFHLRRGKRLRTTGARKDDVFGKQWAQHDQSTISRHNYRRRECRRERYHWAGSPFEMSRPRSRSFSAGAHHLLGPTSRFTFQGWPAQEYFAFEDGSLLTVELTQGSDCIDLEAQEGHCILTLNITGGTGRFNNTSGTLTYTETAKPVLADVFHNPVYFTETGKITGTVFGVAMHGKMGR